MKSWNSHAWYITGILAALFVGSISVQWNAVEGLPGIISFALGLSSLLLAVFAIIQSLTSGSSAEASLSAVREASNGVLATLGDITSVTQELRTVSDTMLQSSEAGRREVGELRKELLSKGAPVEQEPAVDQRAIDQRVPVKSTVSPVENAVKSNRLTFGAAGALYLAILSYQTKKSYKIDEVFINEKSTSYERGLLAGLKLLGYIDWEISEAGTIITYYSGDAEKDLSIIKGAKFPTVKEVNSNRLSKIEAYFVDDRASA